MTVTWSDPPPQRAGRGLLWHPLLVEVTEKPGAWALLRTYETVEQARNAVRHLRRRAPRPPGRFEFRIGVLEGSVHGRGVWARWSP